MIEIRETQEFSTWLESLRDARARGMMQLARDSGLTREGLYKALSPEGNPSFATVMKVCKALGLKLNTEAVEA